RSCTPRSPGPEAYHGLTARGERRSGRPVPMGPGRPLPRRAWSAAWRSELLQLLERLPARLVPLLPERPRIHFGRVEPCERGVVVQHDAAVLGFVLRVGRLHEDVDLVGLPRGRIDREDVIRVDGG